MRRLFVILLALLPAQTFAPAFAQGIPLDLPRLTWPDPQEPVVAQDCHTASKPQRCELPK